MHCIEIKDRCQRLETRLSAKGFVTPTVHAAVTFFNRDYSVWMEYRTVKGGKNLTDYFHSDESMGDAFRQLEAAIDKLKTPAELQREEVVKDLGALIDKARDVGMDVDFINPLTEQMKRLSENVVTDQRHYPPKSSLDPLTTF